MAEGREWRWERWVIGAIGALGSVLIAATQVSASQAASNLASWAKYLGLNGIAAHLHSALADKLGFGVGVAFVAFSVVTFMVHSAKKRSDQKSVPIPQLPQMETQLVELRKSPADLPVQSPPEPSKPEEPERIFVGAKTTPLSLTKLYAPPNTEMQGDAAIVPFVGKWMRVTGTIMEMRKDSVWDHSGESSVCTDVVRVILEKVAKRGNKPSNLPFVFLQFSADRWHGHLSVLRYGEKISAIGKIVRAAERSVTLTDCELEVPRARTKVPPASDLPALTPPKPQ